MAAASRPRPLAATVALVALAVVVAVGLAYLLRFALGPSRPIRGRASFGRPSEDDADGTVASSDQAAETTPRPSAAEGSAVEEATTAAAEEPVAEPQAPAKPRRRLRGLLAWAVYLGIIVGAIVLGPTVLGWALDTDHPMATISSGSMWPALKEGDVVLLRGVDSAEDLKVGNIIAFRHEGGLAIHRIVSIEGEQITTRGDANTRQDDPIAFDDVIGRAVEVGGRLARVPYLGHLAELLGPVVGTATEDPGQPTPAP